MAGRTHLPGEGKASLRGPATCLTLGTHTTWPHDLGPQFCCGAPAFQRDDQGSVVVQVPKDLKALHDAPAALSMERREVPAVVLSTKPLRKK